MTTDDFAKYHHDHLHRSFLDPLTTLRAEVEALREEAWADHARRSKADEFGAEMRALGRGRMAQTVLDLIDKRMEAGQ